MEHSMGDYKTPFVIRRNYDPALAGLTRVKQDLLTLPMTSTLPIPEDEPSFAIHINQLIPQRNNNTILPKNKKTKQGKYILPAKTKSGRQSLIGETKVPEWKPIKVKYKDLAPASPNALRPLNFWMPK
jgi:hypothetical protein